MRIVFLLNSDEKSRYYKRIEEFVARKIDVEVFAVKRYESTGRKLSVPVTIMSTYDSKIPYRKRVKSILNGINSVVCKYKSENVLYYIFGLDVAMLFHISHPCKKYIYEEGDLVHTYSRSKVFRNTMEWIDKRIIRDSILTVFTSEGFVDYHFKKPISNYCVIPNKLDIKIKQMSNSVAEKFLDIKHLRIGFVGAPRFTTILNFFQYACSLFPQHEFHVFGGPIPKEFEKLKQYSNLSFHGPFKSPDDLMGIYSQIDLVLSTYDTDSDNVRYAEPNKLYEAIYFNTPIIVSSNTFLSKKTKELGVGFEIEVTEEKVKAFIEQLDEQSINSVIQKTKSYPKDYSIDNMDDLFDKINIINKQNLY